MTPPLDLGPGVQLGRFSWNSDDGTVHMSLKHNEELNTEEAKVAALVSIGNELNTIARKLASMIELLANK